MKVITKVQSLISYDGTPIPGPIDIAWYIGDSLPEAMSAVATAMAESAGAHTKTISILVEF